MYKIVTYCPPDITDKIIDAASKAGAGNIGNYSHSAFITPGFGNWKSEEGSHPTIGKVGEVTRAKEDRIEMHCPGQHLKKVIEAIKLAHTYEEPVIDIFEIKSLDKATFIS